MKKTTRANNTACQYLILNQSEGKISNCSPTCATHLPLMLIYLIRRQQAAESPTDIKFAVNICSRTFIISNNSLRGLHRKLWWDDKNLPILFLVENNFNSSAIPVVSIRFQWLWFQEHYNKFLCFFFSFFLNVIRNQQSHLCGKSEKLLYWKKNVIIFNTGII